MLVIIFCIYIVLQQVYSVDIITTIAGTGFNGFSGDNGAAISATFQVPSGISVDATGTTVDFISEFPYLFLQLFFL